MQGSRLQGFRRCWPRLLLYRDATFGYWLIVSWYRVAILAKEVAVEPHVIASKRSCSANLHRPWRTNDFQGQSTNVSTRAAISGWTNREPVRLGTLTTQPPRPVH